MANLIGVNLTCPVKDAHSGECIGRRITAIALNHDPVEAAEKQTGC